MSEQSQMSIQIDGLETAIDCYVATMEQKVARLEAFNAKLLAEVKDADQGYDWFREQLESFIAYQGSWTLEVGENWADSLVAHINSRQIGTRAAIADAERGAE